MIEHALAIDIARKRAKEKGWSFVEPLEVVSRRGWLGGVARLEVVAHSDRPGIKARFVIDAKSGKIKSEEQQIELALAIDIARKRAKEKGWGFAEPLDVVDRRAWFGGGILRFEIETNSGKRGTKARFVIDAQVYFFQGKLQVWARLNLEWILIPDDI